MDSDKSLVSVLLKARGARLSMMGASNYAIVTGSVLLPGLGIALGWYVGSLLDARFGAKLWEPLLAILGLAAGGRELFLALRMLTRQSSGVGKPGQRGAAKGHLAVTPRSDDVGAESAGGRRGSFTVPPPPLPSGERAGVDSESQDAYVVPDMGQDTLRRMLKEDREKSSNNDKS